MDNLNSTAPAIPPSPPLRRRAPCAALVLVAAAALAACGDKAGQSKPGQALASVDGHEITVLQLNEELARAGVAADRQEAAGRQLLQALVDRQLLENAAAREKLDRDPKVMEAVERARSLIVARAYLQKHTATVARPTAAEVEDYFNRHPQFFGKRKQFTMNELIIPAADFTAQARAAVDSAGSLEEVAAWLDAHKIGYGRSQVTRNTTDVPPPLSARLLGMPKGQLFVVKEGGRALLVSVAEIKDAPVTLQVAAPQIEQYLVNAKNKELATAELQRLRAGAQIKYINKAMMPDAGPGAPAAAPASAPAPADGADKAALDRGVAGLK